MSVTRLAVVAATLACALLLGSAGQAAAQTGSGTTDLTKRLAVTGTGKGGKKFTGTYTVDRFVSRAGQVFSVGTLKGKLKNRRVTARTCGCPCRASVSQGPPRARSWCAGS